MIPKEEMTLAKLQDLSSHSLYFFAKSICGFEDLLPTTHQKMCQFTQRYDKSLTLAPRGWLKSSIRTIAYPLWRLTQSPDTRILIANEKLENSVGFLRKIKSVFENNTLFRWVYEPILPDIQKTRWTDEDIVIKRSQECNVAESSVETIGVGGTKVSKHYDIIIKDDIIGLEAKKSARVMEEALEWNRYSVSLFEDYVVGTDIITGTRWAENDIYAYIIAEGIYKVQSIPLFDAEGVSTFPTRFTKQSLDLIRRRQGEDIFSTQYLNDPQDKSTKFFNTDWLHRQTLNDKVLEDLYIVAAHDPAGQGKDLSALVVMGYDLKTKHVWLVDGWAKAKSNPDEVCFWMAKFYSQYKPTEIAIEEVGLQHLLVHSLRKIQQENHWFLPLTAVKPGGRSKSSRISSLFPLFASSQMLINSDARPEFLDQFENEYTRWRLGVDNQKDDCLDAIAYAIEKLPLDSSYESEDDRIREDQMLERRNSQVCQVTGY